MYMHTTIDVFVHTTFVLHAHDVCTHRAHTHMPCNPRAICAHNCLLPWSSDPLLAPVRICTKASRNIVELLILLAKAACQLLSCESVVPTRTVRAKLLFTVCMPVLLMLPARWGTGRLFSSLLLFTLLLPLVCLTLLLVALLLLALLLLAALLLALLLLINDRFLRAPLQRTLDVELVLVVCQSRLIDDMDARAHTASPRAQVERHRP